MALSSIVKNIYTFANILSQAGTDAVKNWNDKSLQNALNWAAYCTQISEQTRNSTYRSDLDIQIQSFTVYLKPPSLICLTLDSLLGAKELLCKQLYFRLLLLYDALYANREKGCAHLQLSYKRLLQNPSCPADIVQMICDLEIENTPTQGRNEDSSQKCDKHLFLLLGEEQEFNQSSSTTIGSYILDRLLHLINLTPVSEHRFNRYLEQIIPVISYCDKGMESLAKLLLIDVRSISQLSETEKLKSQIVQHILQISNDQSIWSLDCDLLCKLSSRDDLFLEHHIQYILSWIDSMEPVYGVTEFGDLYTWRCSSENNNNFQTYESLQRHIRLFINYTRRMRSRLHPHLENRANKTYFNICRDLFKCF